jgi:hypothetical protein
LLQKIRHVYASGDESKYLLPDPAIMSFMEHCLQRVGEAYFRAPRTTITSFVNLLAVLEQNPGTAWQTLLGGIEVAADTHGAEEHKVAAGEDDDFSSFKM